MKMLVLLVALAAGTVACSQKVPPISAPKPDNERVIRAVVAINKFVDQQRLDPSIKIVGSDVTKFYWTRVDSQIPKGAEHRFWTSTLENKWGLLADDGSETMYAVSPGIAASPGKGLIHYSIHIDNNDGRIVKTTIGPHLVDR